MLIHTYFAFLSLLSDNLPPYAQTDRFLALTELELMAGTAFLGFDFFALLDFDFSWGLNYNTLN